MYVPINQQIQGECHYKLNTYFTNTTECSKTNSQYIIILQNHMYTIIII